MKIIRVEDPILDVSRFKEDMPKHKAVIMVFMMKDCHHCEMLKPKWETVKHILNKDEKFNDVMVADIDSQVSNLLSLPPVMGFPSIKVMKDDKLEDYNGLREVDPLLTFLRKTVTTPAKKSTNRPKHLRMRMRIHAVPSTKKKRSTERRSTARRSTKRKPSTKRRRSTARRSTARRSTARRSSKRN